MSPGGTGGPDDGQTDDAALQATVHASCLVLDEAGVLIRGPAGSGKSTLCLAVIEAAEAAGRYARLVGDDRIRLHRRHGRLIARPHPALRGLVEIRGLGIRRLARTAEAGVIRLVVDLVAQAPRLPDPPARVSLLGLDLPHLALSPENRRAEPVRWALRLDQDPADAAPQRAEGHGSVAPWPHPAAQ